MDIIVSPEELSKQGESLIAKSQELADILSSVDNEVQAITAGWQGLAQEGYYDMYSEMKTSLDKFPELVESLGQATKSAAEAFINVDTELQKGYTGAIG